MDIGSDLVGSLSFGHQLSWVETFPAKGMRSKRPKQIIRKSEKPLLMVVGEDVGLNDIILTNALTRVGRFGGCKYSPEGVKQWVFVSWKDSVSSCPDVFILQRGWISFKFHSEADVASILTGV